LICALKQSVRKLSREPNKAKKPTLYFKLSAFIFALWRKPQFFNAISGQTFVSIANILKRIFCIYSLIVNIRRI